MAKPNITAKDNDYVIISMAPSVNLTPVGKDVIPLPYPMTHKMGQSKHVSKDVFINKKSAFLHGLSIVANGKGDSAGSKKGVVSGVMGKVSFSLEKSDTVFINGHPIVRTGDMVGMNAPPT
jgi:uncharacterized Zn-binding protein involved in type VI secretion